VQAMPYDQWKSHPGDLDEVRCSMLRSTQPELRQYGECSQPETLCQVEMLLLCFAWVPRSSPRARQW